MGLHDFRRAAATFIAMDAPDKIGLIPGVLQHASPDVSEQHYNLARSVEASRRFAAHLAKNPSQAATDPTENEGLAMRAVIYARYSYRSPKRDEH